MTIGSKPLNSNCLFQCPKKLKTIFFSLHKTSFNVFNEVLLVGVELRNCRSWDRTRARVRGRARAQAWVEDEKGQRQKKKSTARAKHHVLRRHDNDNDDVNDIEDSDDDSGDDSGDNDDVNVIGNKHSRDRRQLLPRQKLNLC